MASQVLARKWRPKTFDELVGQEHVVKALSNALTQQRLHHAYLFTGTRGVGKTTLARILAKALNCETGITPTPCGVCGACQEIDLGRFVDLMEVDAATNTKVEEMRELLDQAQYMPVSGRFKVYIIDEVHMLSRSAFNSMLKTLEEPPEHVKFILATTDPQKVPITVLSRCLQFNLKQMSSELIVRRLTEILGKESIAFDPQALALLARAAQGSVRDGLSLLDQAIAHGAGKVESAQVAAMLGAIDQEYLFDLLENLAKCDGAALMASAAAMAERSLSFDEALQELEVLLHQIAMQQTIPDALDKTMPGYDRLVRLAGELPADRVQLYYQIALNGRKDMPYAPDEYAGFTMTLMRMLAFTMGDGEGPRPVVNSVPKNSAPRAEPSVRSEVRAAPLARVATPVAATQNAKPATPVASGSARGFDGDWLALVERMRAGGMAHMLARQCELRSFADDRFDLVLPEEHKHLFDKSYQEKLKGALDTYFGRPIRIAIEVGKAEGSSLAAIQNRDQKEKQAQAIAAIEQDAFVRELVDTFEDAKLIESSIKPI